MATGRSFISTLRPSQQNTRNLSSLTLLVTSCNTTIRLTVRLQKIIDSIFCQVLYSSLPCCQKGIDVVSIHKCGTSTSSLLFQFHYLSDMPVERLSFPCNGRGHIQGVIYDISSFHLCGLSIIRLQSRMCMKHYNFLACFCIFAKLWFRMCISWMLHISDPK